MERERLVSVVGGRASKYVKLKKPSQIIPFKGNFPILKSYQINSYYEAIRNTNSIDDLSEEFQKVTEKGNRIAILEEGFKRYLSDYNITVYDFLKLSDYEKSDKLIDWCNRDDIDLSQLTIK